MKINELQRYLIQILQPERFADYCPNGLQVEGKQEISKIVTGVTASMALLRFISISPILVFIVMLASSSSLLMRAAFRPPCSPA